MKIGGMGGGGAMGGAEKGMAQMQNDPPQNMGMNSM